MAREDRIGVSLSPYEKAIAAACVQLCGYPDQSSVLRIDGITGARDKLAKVAPEKLAEIDRRFGGTE